MLRIQKERIGNPQSMENTTRLKPNWPQDAAVAPEKCNNKFIKLAVNLVTQRQKFGSQCFRCFACL